MYKLFIAITLVTLSVSACATKPNNYTRSELERRADSGQYPEGSVKSRESKSGSFSRCKKCISSYNDFRSSQRLLYKSNFQYRHALHR